MSDQYTPQNRQGQNKGKCEKLFQPKWQLNVSAGRKKTKKKNKEKMDFGKNHHVSFLLLLHQVTT